MYRSTALIVASLCVLGGLVPIAGRGQTPSPPSGEPSGQGEVEYVVTLTATWTPESHPFEYPEAGFFSGPHFSGLIGASHNEKYAIFTEGSAPTPGLERLSEEGKHSPLKEEIETTIAAGNAGMVFETDPIKDFSKAQSTKVQVSDQYPLVSAVAMIAPSPDWFAGAANIDLKENGNWVEEKTVTLYAWDSGGDDGTTYEAADADTNPKKPTTKALTPHFVVEGVQVPVGTLSFKKQ